MHPCGLGCGCEKKIQTLLVLVVGGRAPKFPARSHLESNCTYEVGNPRKSKNVKHIPVIPYGPPSNPIQIYTAYLLQSTSFTIIASAGSVPGRVLTVCEDDLKAIRVCYHLSYEKYENAWDGFRMIKIMYHILYNLYLLYIYIYTLYIYIYVYTLRWCDGMWWTPPVQQHGIEPIETVRARSSKHATALMITKHHFSV